MLFYPLFPATEIIDSGDKALLAAAEKAVDLRELGSFCGWSTPHMSAVYSRLNNAEKAYNALNLLPKAFLLENFFILGFDYRFMGISAFDCGGEDKACVQLDALMGTVNTIQEMLLLSTQTTRRLLPACPQKFSRGNARLHFTTGTVKLCWDLDKKQCCGKITATRPTDIMLELPFTDKAQRLVLKENEEFCF